MPLGARWVAVRTARRTVWGVSTTPNENSAAPSYTAGAVDVASAPGVDLAAWSEKLRGDSASPAEVLVVAPEGPRWRTSELRERVLHPARFAPRTHRHLVVVDAHAATAAAHDILLKSLEEPSSDTTWWLVHPTRTSLPATLLGRCVRTETLPPPARGEVAARLREAGAAADVAEWLAETAPTEPAAVAAAKYDLTDRVKELCGFPDGEPQLLADRLVLASAHLAVATHHRTKKAPAAPLARASTATHPVADLSKLSPDAKRTQRATIAALFDRWEQMLLTSLSSPGGTHGHPSAVAAALQRLDEVREGTAFNTPVPTIVAAATHALCGTRTRTS